MPSNLSTVEVGQPISARDLSKLTGVSINTIRQLARSQMIPRPISQDEAGNPSFDLADPAIVGWVRALQAAGYNRR